MSRYLRSIPSGIWAAVAVAWALRIWIYYIQAGGPCPGVSEYEYLAQNFIKTGALTFDGQTPSAFRLPFYPLLTAAVIAITGGEINRGAVVVFHFILTAISLGATYHLAKRLATTRIATAATLLMALNPCLAQMDWCSGPEPLLILQLLGVAWAAALLVEKPGSLARWAMVGAATGFSLTTRSTFLVFPFVLAICLWPLLGKRPSVKQLAVLLGCTYVFLGPWLVRNWIQFGRTIPFEDGMGWHTLWQGTTSVEGIRPDEKLPEPMRTYFFQKDPRIGPLSRKLALENIRNAPLTYARYCVGRLHTLWFRGGWAERYFGLGASFHEYKSQGSWIRAGAKVGMKLLELLFVLVTVWGMVAAWSIPAARLLTLMVFYMNIHLLTMGLPRYTWPILPLMYILAVIGIKDLFERAGRIVRPA